MSSGDREVAVEMIGPHRPNPRLAPGQEASGAVAAGQPRVPTDYPLEGCSGHRGPLSKEVGCALSSSCASPARVPPLGGVEVLAGDRRARRDDAMTRSALREWESTQRQTALGAIESEQRVRLLRPVVDGSGDGAQRLGSAYWREVERVTFGLIRSRQGLHGVELRLLGRRPLLLAFGQPVMTLSEGSLRSCCPITGGLLAYQPGGEIVFAQ